ncbi:hypothetical protein AGLY_002477 [Aphis glycines]|uniref:Uncharacterized protein n=1 Tax=Aphis glycines TaxID=307491 RepID=A0A6G0U2W1_APHGL|nr:hypothetical protein AGLY_002477 [Aphis glycines]
MKSVQDINSERSDECIDFTMVYVFFLSVYNITSRNNASISNFGVVSDGKVNICGIFTQNQFSTESIFLYGCNSKTNHCKYLKLSPNVYVSIIYIHVDKVFLAQTKYLKILYKVPHMHNFFLLAFEVQILTKIRQNHEYLQIIFPRSTPPPNVQQDGTHLPAFFFVTPTIYLEQKCKVKSYAFHNSYYKYIIIHKNKISRIFFLSINLYYVLFINNKTYIVPGNKIDILVLKVPKLVSNNCTYISTIAQLFYSVKLIIGSTENVDVKPISSNFVFGLHVSNITKNNRQNIRKPLYRRHNGYKLFAHDVTGKDSIGL